ncbi:MAG: NAD-dependent epimerase/dehydratase family protein [Planctomycetes bacterium]|nr:NAD-dependent epimerase/dehydratase family protein [Planctomycetota bacterium]
MTQRSRPLGPKTRVAVVGTGFIADFHLEILRATDAVEVVAVCDLDLVKAERAARKFGVAKAVKTLRELVDVGVDVAHVLVPPALHVAVTKELLELGIGAFVEKPLALTSREARELGELARAKGVPLAVNHNAVHHPAFAELLARVRAGEIGRVEHVRVCLSVPLRQLDAGDFSHWMFRAPRNIVFEQAPHPYAQLHALIGKVVQAKTSLLGTRELNPGQVFHDRWLVAAQGEKASAEIYLAFGQSFTRSTIEVLGSDGELEADLFHNLIAAEEKTLWLDFWNSFLAGWRRGGDLRRSARRGLWFYLRQTLGLGRREDAFFAGMRGSIQAFHRALRDGARLPATAEDGAEVLEWCETTADGIPAENAGQPKLEVGGAARPGEVVIIGGTGFIGQPTVQRLLDRGFPVTVIVRRTHSLPRTIANAAASGKLRLVLGDLENAASLADAVKGARCVVQLATGNGSSWEAVERAMVQGSRKIAEACAAHGVARYVYVSSSAALYCGADAGAKLDDDVPPDPKPEVRSLYARGKIAAENALMALAKEKQLALVIVRPAVVLGPGSAMQHSGLGLWVRDNHCVGWGRGDTPVPAIWVEDVAEGLARVIAHEGKELDGKALNLAANTGLTAREIVAEFAKASGRKLDFHPRGLAFSQTLEIGKWVVKMAGRRKDAAFPSWRDLKSRELRPTLTSNLARSVLGWKPVEERERFLDVAVRAQKKPSS